MIKIERYYPLKEYMWSNDVLKEIAKILRLYHDAVSDFPLSDDWKPMIILQIK